MSKPLRIVFAGTPEFSVRALAALVDSEHEVIAVLTQPDRPAGRGRQLRASPVKEYAGQCDIPVLQPDSLKNDVIQQQLKSLNADCMVVVAYGLILPEVVLTLPVHGCLNIHASLLPRWRGAAPIQRAIVAGDEYSGVTIMQMDKGLDTGDMLGIQRCKIEDNDTGSSLHYKLALMGAQLLLEVLVQMQEGSLNPQVQANALACYADKLQKAEAKIDWNDNVDNIERKIRAFNAWPVAHTLFQGKLLRIWNACPVVNPEYSSSDNNNPAGKVIEADAEGILVRCGKGALLITQVQLAGKKRVAAKEFINNRVLVATQLGEG
ncbi:Methionyl-tRNA formyltransferase [hydrothermal vent metagenome]|uniref:methionyl-tRNA formyltransferase n=1 Tax=hydrothermal vent metagenome TaxID=652676 RepID=A0A3B0YKD0_9ZZZZ